MAALLEAQSVSKRFGGLQALSNVGFTVAEGEIVGIIGPNGAGKTTLFNVVTGVYPPDSGRVVFRGADVTGAAPHRICKLGAARTFQISKPFADLTVLQTVRIGALNRIRDIAGATMKAMEVLELMPAAVQLEHKSLREMLSILGHQLEFHSRERFILFLALVVEVEKGETTTVAREEQAVQEAEGQVRSISNVRVHIM